MVLIKDQKESQYLDNHFYNTFLSPLQQLPYQNEGKKRNPAGESMFIFVIGWTSSLIGSGRFLWKPVTFQYQENQVCTRCLTFV